MAFRPGGRTSDGGVAVLFAAGLSSHSLLLFISAVSESNTMKKK
jgi:hypothetical protein